MPEFPRNLVSVRRDGYSLTLNAASRRTALDSGLVSQRRTVGRNWMVRKFAINVRESDYAAFRRWQSATGDSFFDFADREDRTTRSVRVQGGAESMELESGDAALLGGDFYYTARISLEGFE